LSDETNRQVGRQIRQAKRPGDVAVASIHWGGNWGYDIPGEQIRFARGLIDEGVEIVHGHSSHHVKALGAYHDRLILYGCGDFLDDYEGISGYPAFREDLRVMYLIRVDPQQGRLVDVRLVPMQVRRLRLNRATQADTYWLCDLLNKLGMPFGTHVQLAGDGSMLIGWQAPCAE
jgi:poly-gamma-glutamate synthesis protein (capsule biosynthesis protein)